MSKNILLINDMPGYGKVALGAMIPILSAMGHYIHNLPTALVSNTLNYGKFEILDTTDYMRNSLKIWGELGFTFDCLCTGFLVSAEQVEMITEFILNNKNNNILVISDPIMGDDGKLYNGVNESRIDLMRKLIKNADITIPNVTEAIFLTESNYEHSQINESDINVLIDKMRKLGPKSVVITSVSVKNSDKHMVCGYNHVENRYFYLPYEHIPVTFPGTGDIFSAVMTGKLLNGHSLEESVKMAMTAVRFLIEQNKNNQDKFKGILIEQFITDIENISSVD
jgi:pyridoxine kinase